MGRRAIRWSLLFIALPCSCGRSEELPVWVPGGMLKTIVSAQFHFREHDSDGNGKKDFWRTDIAGLRHLKGKDGRSLDLIDPVIADADERPSTPNGSRRPKTGYWFRALKHQGETTPSPDRFAACAIPAEYHQGGTRWTVIVDETAEFYQRDLGPGGRIDVFPSDPIKEGWTKLD